MGNTLSFTLGLATGGFLSSVAKAEGAIGGLVKHALSLPGLGVAVGGLIGSVASLDKVVENVFAQFEKGAGLQALSKQTGESVFNLALLEKGFKGVHLSADLVGPALFALQRSLGGFNEMGEPTKDIFASIGLNVDELKKADAPEQFKKIGEGLSKLNSSEAANAASKIFGRGAGREMLQMARGGEEFAAAMKAAGPTAALFARNALAFEKIEQSMLQLRGKFQSVFAGLAEGSAPGIQSLLDKLNSVDLSGFGEKISSAVGGAVGAMMSGQVGELMRLSLTVAFEKSVNVLGHLLQKVAAGFPDMLSAAMMAAKAGIGQSMAEALFEDRALRDAEEANRFPVGSPQNIRLSKRSAEATANADASRLLRAEGIQEAVAQAAEGLAKGITMKTVDIIKNGHGLELEEFLKAGLAALPLSGTGFLFDILNPKGSGGANDRDSDGKLKIPTSHADVNALERIGLVRLGSGGSNPAEATARNTAEMLIQLREINKHKAMRDFRVDPNMNNIP